MKRLKADFDRTFKALEEGLQVEHIAEFDLRTCQPDDLVTEVLTNPSTVSYDQFPVRNSRGIVGVLERRGHDTQADGQRVVGVMYPLDSSMLAADSQPVASLLNAERPMTYRLVVKENDIQGIVTASDLLKLPVRLYAFMLVTHLEMLMAATIRKQYSEERADAWLDRLSEDRREKVLSKIHAYSRKRMEPDPIEFTDFCDKREVLKHLYPSQSQFVRDMKDIEKLRNPLAHAGDYLEDRQDLTVFQRRIDLTRRHIGHLRGNLGSHEF